MTRPATFALGAALVSLGACHGRPMRFDGCRQDDTRACSGVCGQGEETCRDEMWQRCEIPPSSRPCVGVCGDGWQECSAEKWGACLVPPVTRACSSICGSGTETCADGKWQACNAPAPKAPKLTAVIRDFHETFPDMEPRSEEQKGIAEPLLGADDKPVYAHPGASLTVSGPDSFAKWYRDLPGVNVSTSIELPLTPVAGRKGVHRYSNTAFFPIDNQLFGNEGRPHNFHFTAEVATRFRYAGGEVFTFEGDDDVWVFINRRLAIDLGGIHSSKAQIVNLDSQAAALGISKGEIYSMHIFFAERHVSQSDFVVETTIAEFEVCD